MVLALVGYYGHRAYRTARSPPERMFALNTLSTLTIYMVHVYGDVGMAAWHGVFTVAATGVVCAKLAVANGALAENIAPRASTIPRAWVTQVDPALPGPKEDSDRRDSRSA
jgi:hypothetical protein